MCHIKNLQVIQQAEGTEPSSQDDVYWFRALVMKTLAQGHRINSSWDFVLNYPKQPFDTGIPFEHSSSWESQGSPKNETDAKRQKQNEAARRCRRKKQNLLDQSLSEIQALKENDFQLKLRILVLESELRAGAAREEEMQQRIDILSTQLQEASKYAARLHQ